MLSAVVVHADDGRPGEGFFALAEQLGMSVDDRENFWTHQLEKVHIAYGP